MLKLPMVLLFFILVKDAITTSNYDGIISHRGSHQIVTRFSPGNLLIQKHRNLLIRIKPKKHHGRILPNATQKNSQSIMDSIFDLFEEINKKIKEPTGKVYNDKIWMNRFG